MSFKSGISQDNYELKFLELKKYLISSEGSNGLNSIAIDNNQQIIFVIRDNSLVVIQLKSLLTFEWNKSVVNEICQQFPHFAIGLNFRPHLVSISAKGFGSKLAICGTDGQNPSPFIVFFDLNDIYRNQSKSFPFSRINLINSFGLVSDIVWHSEFLDNQFGCCLTDGSLFIILIGDIESKSTTILSQMSSASNSLCLCWSPKGKQLVVGHKSGYFSQYKLIAGQQLQEVKKTYLKNNLNEHNVISIQWIVSSLFAVAVTKDLSQTEKDTHILVVSTPSRAEPHFVDFGSLCLDNFEVNFVYRIHLLHFNNVILCSTSMTSEVTVLGCDPKKEISVPDNWCQWILEDSSRIDLPMDSDGNETYLRGIAISRGTQNVYKLSAAETYGGPDCPLLFVYNSNGVLVPYLMIDRTGFLKSMISSNIAKPAMPTIPISQQKPAMTSTPILATNSGVMPTPVPQPPVMSPLTTLLNSQSVQNRGMPSTPQAFKPSTASIPSPQTVTNEIKGKESKPQSTQSLSGDETTSSAANELYINAIKEQIIEFKKVMNETKKKYSKIEVKIGQKEEQIKLRNDSRLLDEVLKELKDNFKSCTNDTTTLQSGLFESFSLLEETKSIMDRNVDPKYRSLLKQKTLDPITTRMMNKIHDLNEYIETQLRELDAKFDQEWYEWLDTRKALKTKHSNRVSPNSGFEMIYKSLANNQRVINALRLQLDRLEESSPPKSRLIKTQGTSSEKQIIDRLSHNFSKSSLRDIPDGISCDRPFKLKSISQQKKNNLREFFENRTKVPIRRTVDNSSRFISAIEKLKQKQKPILSTKISSPSSSVKSVTNANKEAIEVKSQPIIKSLDNRVNITPTLVNRIIEQKAEPKITIERPIIQQKLEPKSTPLPNLTKVSSQPISTPLRSSATKPDIFQISTKPLNFNLNTSQPLNQLVATQKPFSTPPTSQILSFNLKPQTAPIVAETVIPTKSKADSTKRIESQETSPGSKSVSFGNTTIINPIETTVEESIKLDTVTEESETSENTPTNSSPFTAFKGFGGSDGNDSSFPKLSFNLNQPKSGFSFNSTANSIKSNDSLPKYEDISPPTTPQKTVPQKIEEKEVIDTSVTNIQSSKPFSILKTNPQTTDQKENKIPESSILRSLITDTKPDSTVTAITPNTVATNISVAPISSTTSFSSLTTPQTTTNPTISSLLSGQPVSEPVPQKPEQINTPFSGAPAFGQNTPFASAAAFSFGNTIAPNVNSTPPPFGANTNSIPEGKGLAFGFGANQSAPVSNANTTPSASGLSFGQQSSNLNNLSFCGLGGRPNPENASKNTFGGGFSNPPLQTGLSFNASPQSSPFNIKNTSSGGAFAGSFSSGSAGVAQTGFAALGASSPQQQSPQQTQPVFGGSPLFGAPQQTAFGASPAFGGSPTFGGSPQQSGFGVAPAFGGAPALGSMGVPTFGSQPPPAFNANNAFSGSANSGLSFGAIASSAPQPQQNTSPFNSGFSFGGNSDSFIQRRK